MKIKYKKIKSILLILIEIFIIWQLFSIQSNVYQGIVENPITYNDQMTLIRTSQYTNLTGHPIYIDETDPYKNWSYTAAHTSWCSGSGTGADPYVIEDVYIDGQGSEDCIQIFHSTANFIIRDSIFTNGHYYGIYLYNVSNGELNHNEFSFNVGGMYLYKCVSVDILDNLVYNNSYSGIYLDDYSFSLMDGNDVYYNGYGIGGSWNVNNNSITFNTITFNNGNGVDIGGGDNYIQYNTVNNNEGSGIECYGYRDEITDNNANNNEGYGIYCESVEANIEDNTANFNGLSGIYVDAADCTILNNNANYNKEAGIYLRYEGHVLTGNQLDGCGLFIYPSNKVTMSSYTIPDISNSANGKFIYYRVDTNNLRSSDFPVAAQIILVNCNNSILSNFDLNNVSMGISIHFSHNNSISENHLNYNSLQGIYVKGNLNNITDNDIKNGGSFDYSVSLYSSGNNCSILRNNVTNGGGTPYTYSINIGGDYNNISENIINYGNGMKISGTKAIVLLNTIYNSGESGLYLNNVKNATVKGNDISYCMEYGMYVYAFDTEISGNTINNCLQSGIYLGNADNNIILGNSINSNLNGIYLTYSGAYNNISQNTLKDNKEYGIYKTTYSYYENNNTIVENKMYGCGFGIAPTYLDYIITNDTIDSTNLVNDKPLYLYYNGVNLDESNFTNAGQVILIDCSNSVINNLNLNNGSVGITMYYCNGNEISDVTSENNNLYGIYLYFTDNTIISNNNLNYNSEQGIYMDNCEKGIITENMINNNEIDGLFMISSTDNNYTGNYFIQNQFGITLLSGCTENYFEMNTIHNNTDYGLRILGITCEYNEFYDNSFSNPAGINACDNGSANGYYYNNYWNDYPGKDADDDGIGDTPYSIDGTANSQDIAPIWWDPPVLTVHTPLENSRYRNAPFYNITINEGIADSIWYTVNNTEKIFITQLSGSIEQSAWNSLRDGNIKITFFVNDSRGFITFIEVSVIKTSASEFPIALIITITVISIGAAVGIAVVFLYLKRRKGSGD